MIVHGYGLGVDRHGGYARYARVPAEWVVALPEGLTRAKRWSIGTAGFTAAMSVDALERAGLVVGAVRSLVLGATGGVGSVAVALLAARGYEVVASTGSPRGPRLTCSGGRVGSSRATRPRPSPRGRSSASAGPVPSTRSVARRWPTCCAP